jgi:hypothetical protein
MDKRIYEIVELPFGNEGIQMTDADGKVWSIPQDPNNADYQRYLEQLEEAE